MNLRKISRRVLKTGPGTFGFLMGLYPAYIFFGVRVRFYDDFKQAKLILPFRWYIKNGHGTIFGGAIGAVSDPFPAIMISRKFPWALTWTKAHKVEFLKPGRTALTADIILDEHILELAEKELIENGRFIHTFTYWFVNKDKEKVAEIQSTVYARNPRHSRYLRSK